MLCGAFLLEAYWSNIWKHVSLLLKTKHYVWEEEAGKELLWSWRMVQGWECNSQGAAYTCVSVCVWVCLWCVCACLWCECVCGVCVFVVCVWCVCVCMCMCMCVCVSTCARVRMCKRQKPMVWTPKAMSWQFTLGSMLGDNHRQPRTERWCRHKSVIPRYGVSSPKRGNHAVAWVSLNMINIQDYQDQKVCVHSFTRTAEQC